MMRRLSQPASTARDERGAVMVLVAVTLPVIFLFVAFGVEVGHWYDYSRNLQNRADAAALAAGDAFGATCFGSNATSAQTDVIGQTAQQYAGPPVQDITNPYTVPNNLPYPYSTFAQYQNVPNLTRGTPPNYHLLLNSTAYWNNGGTNWSMESAAQRTADPAPPSSLAICGSTDEDGNTGPMAGRPRHAVEHRPLLPVLRLHPHDQRPREGRPPGRRRGEQHHPARHPRSRRGAMRGGELLQRRDADRDRCR